MRGQEEDLEKPGIAYEQNSDTNRLAGLDYLRVAAIFTVVWIHGSDTNALAKWLQTYAGFAVPCFVLISGYLSQRGVANNNRSFGDMVIERLWRLLPAYLAWSGIYLLLRSAKEVWVTGGTSLDYDWILVIFCGGASYQLWFIPALFVYTIIFGILQSNKVTRIKGIIYFVFGVLILIIGIKVAHIVIVPDEYGLFVRSTMAYAGYYLIGMSIFLLSSQKWYQKVGPALPALVSAVVASVFHRAFPIIALLNVVFSIALFWFSERIRSIGSVSVVQSLSAYALGIYMVHVIFIEGLQLLLPRIGFDLTSFLPTLFVIIAAFILSAILCASLVSIRRTRWLVL